MVVRFNTEMQEGAWQITTGQRKDGFLTVQLVAEERVKVNLTHPTTVSSHQL
jgi:hypothetical protein